MKEAKAESSELRLLWNGRAMLRDLYLQQLLSDYAPIACIDFYCLCVRLGSEDVSVANCISNGKIPITRLNLIINLSVSRCTKPNFDAAESVLRLCTIITTFFA